MTTRAFVIGHPIAHSRSPLIHGAWLAEYGIAGTYEALDVAPDALGPLFDRLRGGEFAGGNVTIPLKQAVFALCDTLDPLARTIGAVNTLIARDGAVHGLNTDYLGFLGNLDQQAPGWDAGLDTAIVLGAGGAARAVLVALAARNVKNVHLLNRTPGTALGLAAEIGSSVGAGGLAEFSRLAPEAGLLVNASSVGMHGTRFDSLALDRLPPHAIVADLVYVPLKTPLLVEVEAAGLRGVDGLGMLLHQAVPGFEAWFGVRPEVKPALIARVAATLGA